MLTMETREKDERKNESTDQRRQKEKVGELLVLL